LKISLDLLVAQVLPSHQIDSGFFRLGHRFRIVSLRIETARVILFIGSTRSMMMASIAINFQYLVFQLFPFRYVLLTDP
jgi:hypothetical protein